MNNQSPNKNSQIINNQIKTQNISTNFNFNKNSNNRKKFASCDNTPINRNRKFSQTYSNIIRKSTYRNNKNLNFNSKKDNNGVNINIILSVSKRLDDKNKKEQEEKNIPKISPYNFKYFCNTSNKKSISRALSTNNTIKNTNQEMESNFIKLSKDANIYTSNANYITNKKLLLFDKYSFENNKYKPNRAYLFDMTSIPHTKNKTNIVYKTTKFRGGRMFFYDSNKNTPSVSETENNNNLHNINTKKKPLYLQDLEKYQLKTQNEYDDKNRIDKFVDNSYQNHKRHPPSNTLYKEIMIKKNEIYDNFVNNEINENNKINYPLTISSLPSSPKLDKENEILKKINKNGDLNGYSSLLYKKKNDGVIPIIFPLVCSNAANCDTISQRNRFENIMETFTKLKSLIENDQKLGKNNETDYITDFILNKNIDKKYINNQSINNFSNFLKCAKLPIDTNKSLKDNIILALNYDKNKRNITIYENINDIYDFYANKKKKYYSKNKHVNSENKFNNKSLEFNLERQRKLYTKENYKNDLELRDALKKEVEIVENEVENKQSIIRQVEDNLNLIPFEENYYGRQNMNRKSKITNNDSKGLILMPSQDISKSTIHDNSSQNKKAKNKSKLYDTLFDSNERLYYLWYKNKNRGEIKNYQKNSKLTEYIIYNRTKDKILKKKIEEIVESGKI